MRAAAVRFMAISEGSWRSWVAVGVGWWPDRVAVAGLQGVSGEGGGHGQNDIKHTTTSAGWVRTSVGWVGCGSSTFIKLRAVCRNDACARVRDRPVLSHVSGGAQRKHERKRMRKEVYVRVYADVW